MLSTAAPDFRPPSAPFGSLARRSPWTGRDLPNPTPQQIYSEWAQAEAVNHDAVLQRSDETRWHYGSAVEHALDWVRGTPGVVPTD